MMAHGIIDNRREKLVDHNQVILPQPDVARFSAGHLQTEAAASEEEGEHAK